MVDGIAWIQPQEQELIVQMRASLSEELKTALPELTHDHQFVRFLRGHGGIEKAIEKMRLALRYRTELAATEPFASMRAATAGATAIDLNVLPYADEVLQNLPLRAVEGSTVEGLPVCLSVTRLFKFGALTDGTLDDAHLDAFLRAMIEQRAIVCHTLSVAQRRLVKCVDLRDLTGISVSEILTSGRPFIAKLGKIISVIQDFYPELIHKAFIFNASPAFSQLFALVSPMLNARMQAKVQVFALGGSFEQLACRMEARACWSWLSQVRGDEPSPALGPNGVARPPPAVARTTPACPHDSCPLPPTCRTIPPSPGAPPDGRRRRCCSTTPR